MFTKRFCYITVFFTVFLLVVSCASSGTAVGTMPLDEAIKEAAEDIENRLEAGTKIAILNFSSPSEQFSNYVLEELSAYLVNGRKLVVVERKELDLIRKEEQFQLSGEVSDESAQAIGKKLGAQVIVSGSLSDMGKSYRFRIKTLTVETAAVETTVSTDIKTKEQKVVFLLAGVKPQEGTIPEGLLYEKINRKSITITEYIGNDSEINIPELIDGLPVTVIGEYAFFDCDIKNITIPSSVTTIGECAFSGCSLTSVSISSSVTTIGEGAFSNSSLLSINVDMRNTNYTSVGGVLFDKSGKTLICYPAGKKGAYDIPLSVTTIGVRAFYGCDGLTNVDIPLTVRTIGVEAFRACMSLSSITIPQGVKTIEALTFMGCDNLSSVTIPSSVTAIGALAFQYCNKLSSVTISRKTMLGNGAFEKSVRILYRD